MTPSESTTEAVKSMLAEMSEMDLWMDVGSLAANIDGASQEEVGEVIAQLQTGELAEPGEAFITWNYPNAGLVFYQFKPADGEPKPADA